MTLTFASASPSRGKDSAVEWRVRRCTKTTDLETKQRSNEDERRSIRYGSHQTDGQIRGTRGRRAALRAVLGDRELFGVLWIDHPFDPAFLERHDIEVQEQPDGQVCQLQLREDLALVDLGQGSHDLQFDHHHALDDHVDVVLRSQADALVDDWHGAVCLVRQTLFSQLVLQAFAVDVLEDSGAHHIVHADRAADDPVRDRVGAEWIGQHDAAMSKDRTAGGLVRVFQ